MTNDDTATHWQARDGLLASELSDSEVVMLDMDKGTYFGCEGVAKTIWTALAEPASLADLTAAVQADFPDAPAEVRDDVVAFLDQLVEANLVVAAEGR